MIRLAVLALLLLIAPASAQSVRVVDGDTLEIEGQRIRLFGIDAPERGQRGAMDAALHLRKLVSRGPVTCVEVDYDRHWHRVVSLCSGGHGDLSLSMVRAGHAVVWCSFVRRLRPDLWPTFKRAEDEAKAAKRGLWAKPLEEWRDWGCAAPYRAANEDVWGGT